MTSSPEPSNSGLASPRPESPTTPKASEPSELPADDLDSQATTPMAAEAPSWNRSFLGLSFSSSFLRRSTPVSRPSTPPNSVAEIGNGSNKQLDDEDDRRSTRTLKGVPRDNRQQDDMEDLEQDAGEKGVDTPRNNHRSSSSMSVT